MDKRLKPRVLRYANNRKSVVAFSAINTDIPTPIFSSGFRILIREGV